MDGCTVQWSKTFKMFFCFTIVPPCTLLTKTAINRDLGIIQLIPPITWNMQVHLHHHAGCTGSNKMDQRCAFTYQFTKTPCSCLHCHSLKEDNGGGDLKKFCDSNAKLRLFGHTVSICKCLDMCECIVRVCALPGKMELSSTGAWLVSTVILNLVVLAGEEGTHTNASGRLNLDWRTLGIPEKIENTSKLKKTTSIIAFPFDVAFCSPQFSAFPFWAKPLSWQYIYFVLQSSLHW